MTLICLLLQLHCLPPVTVQIDGLGVTRTRNTQSSQTRADVMPCMQTVGDSCRTLQNIQFRKEDAQPSELADELAYQCGDAATTVEIQYTANLRAVEPAKFLDTLLEPAVVRSASSSSPNASPSDAGHCGVSRLQASPWIQLLRSPSAMLGRLTYRCVSSCCPLQISSGQCPDRSAGTSAALRQLLHTLYPVQVMNIATDHTGGGNITVQLCLHTPDALAFLHRRSRLHCLATITCSTRTCARPSLAPPQLGEEVCRHGVCVQEFIRITEGYTYPGDGGGVINEVTYVENQDKPSAMQYVESIPGLLTNGSTSLPKPVGADTKVGPSPV